MTFVFVFYFPVQFSKSFPLFLQTARWLSHRFLPLSTSFFRNLFYDCFSSLSAHRKYFSLSLWLISCQSSPTACIIYHISFIFSIEFYLFYAEIKCIFLQSVTLQIRHTGQFRQVWFPALVLFAIFLKITEKVRKSRSTIILFGLS